MKKVQRMHHSLIKRHTFHFGQTYPIYGGTEKKGGTQFQDIVKSQPDLVNIIRF